VTGSITRTRHLIAWLAVLALAPAAAFAGLVPGGSFKDGFHTQAGINGEVGNYFTGYNRNGNPAWLHQPVESMDGDSQQIWSDGIAFESGIYQQLHGHTAGISYQLSAWAATTYTGASRDTYDTGQRIGIDPHGGTNPNATTIVWSATFWQNNIFHQSITKALARGDTITVFVEVNAPQGRPLQQTWIDVVEEQALPTVRITAGPAASPGADGTSAAITWDTDLASTSQVRYGLTSPDERVSPLDATLVTHHSVTLTGLNAGATYHYYVISTRTGNEAAISEADTFQTAGAVTTTSPAGTIVAGWNLISVPRSPQNPSPATVFAGIPIDGRLHRWDAVARAYVTYLQANPTPFGNVQQGVGYWLHADGPYTISYTGIAVAGEQRVALPVGGWHLVGHPQAAATALSGCSVHNLALGITEPYPTAVALGWLSDPLYAYDTTAGAYHGTGLDPWDADNMLRPWRGYWMATTAGANLELIAPN
jgi:hypothetical protein